VLVRKFRWRVYLGRVQWEATRFATDTTKSSRLAKMNAAYPEPMASAASWVIGPNWTTNTLIKGRPNYPAKENPAKHDTANMPC